MKEDLDLTDPQVQLVYQDKVVQQVFLVQQEQQVGLISLISPGQSSANLGESSEIMYLFKDK